MRRRITLLLVVASTLICLGAAALWVRSYFIWDSIYRSNWTQAPLTAEAIAYANKNSPGATMEMVARGEGYGLSVWRGRLTWSHGLQLDPMSRWDDDFLVKYVNKPNWSRDARVDDGDDSFEPPGGEPHGFLGQIGFANDLVTSPRKFVEWHHTITIPLWLIALAGAILPFAWIRSGLRARSRRQRGLCSTCGYDLREAAERCPECGVAIVA